MTAKADRVKKWSANKKFRDNFDRLKGENKMTDMQPPNPCPYCGRQAELKTAPITKAFVACEVDNCVTGPIAPDDLEAISRWNKFSSEKFDREIHA